METPPVLLLAFNRPDLAREVLGAIRQARPAKLFIAADGPRAHKPGEAAVCAEVRRLAQEVDWPCEIKTRFNEENQGCKRGVSGAIGWFFEHVEEGVILEDDCLPHPSFFPYCAEMLARYRDDDRVGMVSGNNFRPSAEWRESGHEFTLFTFIWGWATWRRAWRRYEGALSDWPERRADGWLRRLFGRQEPVDYFTGVFDRCHAGYLDSWAFPWSYSCWRSGYLGVVPACNLVSNIGFDERSTHTFDANSPNARLAVDAIRPPWDAAPAVARDRRQDEKYLTSVYGVRLFGRRKRLRLALRAGAGGAVAQLGRLAAPLLGRRRGARLLARLLARTKGVRPGRARLGGRIWAYADAAAFGRDYERIFLRHTLDLGGAGGALRIVDCGAGAGLATVYLRNKYPRAEIIATEPDPARRALLLANLAASGISDVRVLDRAATVPLGELLGESPVDLLRLDLAGAEREVLAESSCLAKVRRVVVEHRCYEKKAQVLDELLGVLRRANFRVQIHSELVATRPFIARPDADGVEQRLSLYAWRQ